MEISTQLRKPHLLTFNFKIDKGKLKTSVFTVADPLNEET